jgi:tetratricopeptide (TPR) repeat protein
LVLDTLNKLVYEVQEHLSDEPALFKSRERVLQTAIAELTEVARHAEGADFEATMVTAHQRLGEIFLLLGRTGKARKHFEQCHALASRLLAANPGSLRDKRAVCVATMNLGEVSLRAGDVQKARDYSRQAVALARALLKANQESVEAQRDLLRCYNRLGNADFQGGDTRAAVDSYRRAVILGQQILPLKADADAKLDLAQSYGNLGDAHLRMGEARAARKDYRKALNLYLALAGDRPDSPRDKHNLAITYQKLGDIDFFLRDGPSARQQYARALAACEELFKITPPQCPAPARPGSRLWQTGRGLRRIKRCQVGHYIFHQGAAPA